MRVAVVVGVALALVAPACADGTDRLSIDEFIRHADAMCREWNGESGELLGSINEEGARAEGVATLEEAATVLRRLERLLRDHLGRLERLVPPKDLEDGFESARARLRVAGAAVTATADAAQRGDERAVSRHFEDYLQATDAFGLWAQRSGFRSCGRRTTLEAHEAAELVGPPMDAEELREYCAELRTLADGVGSLPTGSPEELRRRVRELETLAADLADGPPPNIGGALLSLRSSLRGVRKTLAEHGYDVERFAPEDGDPLAPLEVARNLFMARAFALGGCAT